MVSGGLTSAGGVLSLLDDPDEESQVFALTRLNELVDNFWPEISEAISKIETFYENTLFPERELSALVASKVHYHLGSFADSLTYALSAGTKFDVNSTSEYTETILSKCIDHYMALRVKQFEKGLDKDEEIDSRLEAIVNRMFERCLKERQYQYAAGVAFETRRIDILERAITESNDIKGMLSYCLKISLTMTNSHKFRNMALQVLVRIYSTLSSPDYINICQCYIFLDDAERTAHILETLSRGSHDDVLVAYQIAFDLYESATQFFLNRVQETIRGVLPAPSIPITTPIQESGGKAEGDDKMETDDNVAAKDSKEGTSTAPQGEEGGGATKQEKGGTNEDTAEPMDVEDGFKPPTSTPTKTTDKPKEEKTDTATQEEEPWIVRLRSVSDVLSGEKTISFHQDFLIRCNQTDLQILKIIKDAGRNSITHNATIITNGIMHYGTTCDIFLRENLEWLKRASNWGKFTAIGSLGVIHYGHEKEALNLMSSYLPDDTAGSPYSEGGALYALGLIYANHGHKIMTYLSNELRNNQNEVVRHGGCLGLGLAAMGSADLEVYDLLRDNLFQDDAVVGEAAGIGMGLVMLGTRSPMAIKDMIDYAQETQHEKIQRGLALGISMLFFGQMEEADTAIEQLMQHKDPLLRRAGMFTMALAYCGTGDNATIRRLLHVAVSDVDSDVRRAAVSSIGFILFRNPDLCPSVVSLLAESFNPHVRCGAAWALGIACASTGNKDALAILEPMLEDGVPFVQQGALVASSLIIMQHTEAMSVKANKIRQQYTKIITDKLEDSVTKFGAILGKGIIDAGGRNVTISLQSRTGHTHMPTVVGLLVFSQFWFWFPLTHFISLSFTPTTLIAINKDLKMPKLEFKSNAKPSLYGYVPALEKEKGKERGKVATAVLSVTAKKSKLKKQSTATQNDAVENMEVESSENVSKESGEAKQQETKQDDTKKTEPTKKEAEPNFQILQNPARVLPQQLKLTNLVPGRYKALKPISSGGILVVKNTDADAPEDILEPLSVGIPGQDNDEDEPQPPEPFEYIEET